jgi:hypothetical protein
MATASFEENTAGKCVLKVKTKLADELPDKHGEDVEDEVMLQQALRK